MKADADVKMVAAEAPAVFARACEMFILELTLRAWLHAEGARRRTLQRGDVTAAIQSTETYDLLTNIVPEEERSWSKGDGGVPPATMTTTAVPVVVLPPPSYSYGPAPVTSSVPFATYANMQPVIRTCRRRRRRSITTSRILTVAETTRSEFIRFEMNT
jgi:nuclear transcription factor Y gamma